MGLIAPLIASVVFVLVTTGVGVLSAAEGSVRLLSRSRTRRLIESERRGAIALDTLVERPSRLLAASALLRALGYPASALGVAWAVATAVQPTPGWVALGLAGVVAAVLAFVLGETLPRTLAVHDPERVGLAAAPAAARMAVALAPVARGLGAGWTALVGFVADEPVTDVWLSGDEYRPEPAAAEETAREGAEEAFIEAVVDFSNTIVREVMVPRTDMKCLEDTTTVAEALEIIGHSGFSRLPVYHETLDDIRGVLYAKDLLLCVGAGACPETVAGLVREAYFVPETKPVDELLLEMRERKTHIAVVADEYGGIAGLVTIEDLLEEIVGEIFDEYDRAEPMVVELEGGSLLLDARLPIDDFNDLLGTAIDLEADSIGGLFVELAGHIPAPGEVIEVEGVRITARDVDATRVRRLVVEPGRETEKENEHAEAHHAD